MDLILEAREIPSVEIAMAVRNMISNNLKNEPTVNETFRSGENTSIMVPALVRWSIRQGSFLQLLKSWRSG